MVRKMQRTDSRILNRDRVTDSVKEDSLRKVKVGKRNGLRLVLDQHSNRVSFGTVSQDHSGFQVFIGTPEEFPVIKDRSLIIQSGCVILLSVVKKLDCQLARKLNEIFRAT